MAVITGISLQEALVEAGIIPSNCRRIVIDIPYDGLAMVYYECLGSDKLLEFDLPRHLQDAIKINVSGKKEPPPPSSPPSNVFIREGSSIERPVGEPRI